MSIDFARDGHVLDLALERFVLADLDDAERQTVKAHLRDCALCRGRADQARLDLSVPMPALEATRATMPATTPVAAAAPRAWVGAALGLVAGLIVLGLFAWLRGR